ncbi:MAG: NAD(+) synthase [Aureliella sp.]
MSSKPPNQRPDSDFVRITAASHPIAVANPQANLKSASSTLKEHADSQVVFFSELSLTGYSCGDLFAQERLLDEALVALKELANSTNASNQIVVAGLPVRIQDRLMNAAAVLFGGRVQGIVPKQHLPNYQEFYEARWFHPADGSEPSSVDLGGQMSEVPFGIDLLFKWGELTLGVELCEDLWMPVPPSSLQATAGANVLINLSASNELVGKADWREVLVRSQSGRCLAAYGYSSAGPTESTTDVVFGGHCIIAENGALLAESPYVGDHGTGWQPASSATADVDLQKISHDRQKTTSWQMAAKRSPATFRTVLLADDGPNRSSGQQRVVPGRPFVPKEGPALHRRCSEILGIQCAALAKRVSRLPSDLPLFIGVSGGLDSTLALLVAARTAQQQGWSVSRIHGITMPGFGTTDRTLKAAQDLMRHLKITSSESDIRQLCLDTFVAMQHKPFGIDVQSLDLATFCTTLDKVPDDRRKDLVFENVQARVRTLLLMNHGFVLGTGDLSEQALGWSTYNGDHMSMYNVNTSVPKTLVKFLVRYLAEHEFDGETRQCLESIVETPISPELLPPAKDGSIQQHTESSIGPYELHDFFLYHLLRYGSRPSKILHLASLAEFTEPYSEEMIRATLKTFLKRFFANQFKRSCVPDGPKVGSVSLSPRGDWRMPSDADADAWLAELDQS